MLGDSSRAVLDKADELSLDLVQLLTQRGNIVWMVTVTLGGNEVISGTLEMLRNTMETMWNLEERVRTSHGQRTGYSLDCTACLS